MVLKVQPKKDYYQMMSILKDTVIGYGNKGRDIESAMFGYET